MLKKIILGTANLNQFYGFKNLLIKNTDHKKIFDLNLSFNNSLDTAIAYHQSLKIIREHSYYKSRIYSKLPCIFKNKINSKNLEKIINKHFIELNCKKIYSLSFHSPENLNKKEGVKIYKKLIILKKKKLIKNIGISINFISDLKILKKFKFDLVQLPLNIFDQRFANKEILKFFLKRKIKLQIRSIFLQGTLLEKKTPNNLKKYSNFFNNFALFCKKTKKSQLYHCINFIKNIRTVDSIVVGISNLQEFKELKKQFLFRKRNFNYSQFKNNNLKLIVPKKWK